MCKQSDPITKKGIQEKKKKMSPNIKESAARRRAWLRRPRGGQVNGHPDFECSRTLDYKERKKMRIWKYNEIPQI